MKLAIFAVVLTSLTLADVLESKRDEPLQTTWIGPKKIVEVHGRGGLLAERLKVFPFIGQSFKQDRKWLTLSLRFSGRGQVYTTDVLLSVDGEITTITNVSWMRRNYDYWDLADISEQEQVIRRIAKAREVFVTIATFAGRASFKLRPEQIDCFKSIIERYDSLKP